MSAKSELNNKKMRAARLLLIQVADLLSEVDGCAIFSTDDARKVDEAKGFALAGRKRIDAVLCEDV